MPIPRVVDISHHNTVTNFDKIAAAGIWGVIHKATQGTTYDDPNYAGRRQHVKDAGMLWGAYHFNTGDKVSVQVEHFLAVAAPDDQTLMALDFEDNRLSQMSIYQAVEFLHILESRLGRKGVIYSGNRLKEKIGLLSNDDQAYVASHRLWLAQYGPVAHVPKPFEVYWIWQYTGDGVGPLPHTIDGIIDRGVDINTYNGTREELISEWASRGEAA